MDYDIPDGFLDMVDNMGFEKAMTYAMAAMAAKSGNTITNWSYNLPAAPGAYLCCYGDVETLDNITYVRFIEEDGKLKTEDGIQPHDYSAACKWARLLVSASEVKDAY